MEETYDLPAETKIGRVQLRVSDLRRTLAFYHDLLGFRLLKRSDASTALSATGQQPELIRLVEHPGALRKPRQTTGLYHVAIRFPSRRALAAGFRRLLDGRWPFQGFSDHGVSEALYLADPDGNGIELYVDRPRESWGRQDGQIAMTTQPLDLDALLGELDPDAPPWTGIDTGTDIGHVHLQVSNLAHAEAFYNNLLGLEVTQRSYPGALFLSAGGYHHHLGVNTWAGEGAPPPPPNAVGLISFGLELPDEASWQTLVTRLQAAGQELDTRQDPAIHSALLHDPDGIGVEVLYTRQPVAESPNHLGGLRGIGENPVAGIR
jgi:catechol 2,3-dioxygenase